MSPREAAVAALLDALDAYTHARERIASTASADKAAIRHALDYSVECWRRVVAARANCDVDRRRQPGDPVY